ncbi:hypothetical protein CPT_Moabite_099 [Serratia phage Moabite]|uniref:Uncharacterized protein n=3 Tax=Moabitevirus TaxID=2843422 RepID=A0A7T3TLV5_9CAUD|nr:hypothetical protein HWB23_gp006 [Serratia phage vB_SmaM_ 2050HW]YP_009849193.1 hypothetical protein HWC48_gp317 [Serratia phage Moabite]QPX76724.1 hypothetical protein [Serratia phage vB_SmaM_Yaphecito]UCR74631.1 hypothetical protein [Serratia phage BUCT660]UGO53985.1 hypothetical protein HAYMO_3 [Serratia phage vB_SmaM_Haymo]UQT03493.1 hypothetical protein KODAMA_00260 [Serratia phage vB_SmaM-Kodama]URG14198.1 hypothetical protein [Pectobacterium phage vB_ParM-25]
MLRRAYDLDNGIYSEAYDKATPYSIIEMNQVEAAANKGKFVELLEFFRLHEVGKELNMSFTEFINLDNDIIETIKLCCTRWRSEDDSATREALQKSGIDPRTGNPIKPA